MLTRPEIYQIVNGYIEVHGGYLGDFSYRTHADFYPQHCDLDIDPYQFQGTTREKFLHILTNSSPFVQAKILKGVLAKYPPEFFPPEKQPEKIKMAKNIENIVARLEQSSVDAPELEITSDVVERALQDARALIGKSGPTSAIDRVHTALHGYLKAVCDREGIAYASIPTMNQLLKELRKYHPALAEAVPGQNEIDIILRSLANVFDNLNPIRNNASVAHPNASLLKEEEAMFVINAGHTILQYLNAKFRVKPTTLPSIDVPILNLDEAENEGERKDIPF